MEGEIQHDAELSADLEDDIEDLQQILALGKKEGKDIVATATGNAYKCAHPQTDCVLSTQLACDSELGLPVLHVHQHPRHMHACKPAGPHAEPAVYQSSSAARIGAEKGMLCRTLLREAFRKGGELDTSQSKAVVLDRLCSKLNFATEDAQLLHRCVGRNISPCIRHYVLKRAGEAALYAPAQVEALLWDLHCVTCAPGSSVQTRTRSCRTGAALQQQAASCPSCSYLLLRMPQCCLHCTAAPKQPWLLQHGSAVHACAACSQQTLRSKLAEVHIYKCRQLYQQRVSGYLDAKRSSPTALTLNPGAAITGVTAVAPGLCCIADYSMQLSRGSRGS